ncbi:hypothetical protein GU926_05805 [Nibribacter ruber]|uniref:Glutaminyl-tRNA synthetase n=1 Tax=Nibribacter ruber TaxID=2698458 RepID=A0A6P1NSY4_9BACT|nr:DUF6370 family protein [Nibribacter ruber]QHL86976.1 hypothetical protein GU926_05805 [Nibribacter ruber]
MKTLLLALFISCCAGVAQAQTTPPPTATPDKATPVQTVEAACGQCMFGLKASGCDLAVRIDGKAYFVDGSDIDQHGDAHATDGFCNAIRKAEVQGTVTDNRFKATYFRLLPDAAKK